MSTDMTNGNTDKWNMAATDSSAIRYSRTNAPQHAMGNSLSDKMEIKEGQHVLVAACGPGNDVFAIASIVGSSGKVVGFDLDNYSIEEARKTLEEKHANLKPYVELHTCDAHDLSIFKSQSFDAIHCNASYHWFADQPRFLAQAANIAKPGACIGIATQDGDFVPSQMDIRIEVLTEMGEECGKLCWHPNPGELRRDLVGAGWRNVQLSQWYATYALADGETMWNWLNDSSGNAYGNYLPDGKRERMKEMTLERYQETSLPDGRPVMQLKHLFALAYNRT